MCMFHFITQNIKNICIQGSRFNKIQKLLLNQGFLRELLFYFVCMCTVVKDVEPLVQSGAHAFNSPTVQAVSSTISVMPMQ